MKISELIAELEKAMAEHGDIPVAARDSEGDFSGVQDTEVHEAIGSKVVLLG